MGAVTATKCDTNAIEETKPGEKKMGQQNDTRSPNSKTKSKRGSVRNDRRLEAISQRRKGAAADWQGCSPDRIQAIVHGITAIGGAVTFGTSRDGGAYSVTLLLDGDRETLWFNGDVRLDDEMQAVIDTLAAMQN